MQTSRRDFVGQGGAALGGLALINTPFLAQAFPSRAGEQVLPWLDQPPENPEPGAVRNLLRWQELDSWITPNDEFFAIGHYNWPVIDAQTWTPRGRRADRATAHLHPRRAAGAAAARGRVHAGVLRQPRLPLVHRRHRHRDAGRARRWRPCWRKRASWTTAARWSSAAPTRARRRCARSRRCSTSPAACRSPTP